MYNNANPQYRWLSNLVYICLKCYTVASQKSSGLQIQLSFSPQFQHVCIFQWKSQLFSLLVLMDMPVTTCTCTCTTITSSCKHNNTLSEKYPVLCLPQCCHDQVISMVIIDKHVREKFKFLLSVHYLTYRCLMHHKKFLVFRGKILDDIYYTINYNNVHVGLQLRNYRLGYKSKY